MSEEAIKERIEVYRLAFENLYARALADIQRLGGTQAQASQEGIEKLKEEIRFKIFGERWDRDGNVVRESDAD